MIHNNISNYYQVIFALVQHHKYSITEVENLIPFERDLYVEMLVDYIEEEKAKQQQQR
jgi:hypothetical protein